MIVPVFVPGAQAIHPFLFRCCVCCVATGERYGSSMDRVVKCTVFLVDMSEWGAMNAVYTTYFAADKRPARSAVGTNGLVGNGRVEIECIAVMP